MLYLNPAFVKRQNVSRNSTNRKTFQPLHIRTTIISYKTQHTMKKTLLTALLFAFLFSCVDEDKDEAAIKQQEGEIWRSGGLALCAEQIHLANGDTLIVDLEDIMDFSAGDRVNVRYTERGLNEACAPGINGEIIEIRKME